ncbi:MAG: rod-binding protein [Kordiimonas sp.]
MQTQVINTAQAQIFEAQAKAAKNGVHTAQNGAKGDNPAMRKAAEDFEAVFLSQMIKPMFDTLPTDTMFGGGQAESIYRGLMVEEFGKSVAKNGGIGIADSVYRELLKLQEQ